MITLLEKVRSNITTTTLVGNTVLRKKTNYKICWAKTQIFILHFGKNIKTDTQTKQRYIYQNEMPNECQCHCQ